MGLSDFIDGDPQITLMIIIVNLVVAVIYALSIFGFCIIVERRK